MAREEMMSETAMRVIAVFRRMMFSRSGLGTKNVEILSPAVEKN
jgi:hypothetical protein